MFLLESQHHSSNATFTEGSDAEDRSFIFLLYPNLTPESTFRPTVQRREKVNSSDCDSSDSSDGEYKRAKAASQARENSLQDEVEPVRVPFRSVVIGLLANQVLLQTIGSILVQGSCHIIPSLANVLMQGAEYTASSSDDNPSSETGDELSERNQEKHALPGLLSNLLPRHVLCLLSTLELSYVSALEFDARPGLKFLMQKVASSERAANLYRQAGASWTLRAVALTHLVLHASSDKGVTSNQVKGILDLQAKSENTVKRKMTRPEFGEASKKSDQELNDNDQALSYKPLRPSSLLDNDTATYIKLLGLCFQELCDMYLDLMSNKERRKAEIDDVSEHQPLFFLSVKADEFPTEHRKNVDEWSKNMNEFNKKFLKGKGFEGDEVDDDLGASDANRLDSADLYQNLDEADTLNRQVDSTSGEKVEDDPLEDGKCSEDVYRKPFMLADFVQDYSSDSDDSSLPEFWTADQDSGVASVSDVDQQVFRIVSNAEVRGVVQEYRRRKPSHALPPRHNPFSEQPTPQHHPPVPPEIHKQRDESLTKVMEYCNCACQLLF